MIRFASPRTLVASVDKKALSERDICTKFINPALIKGGWDVQLQVRENVHLTKGRVIVRGRLVTRGTALQNFTVACRCRLRFLVALVYVTKGHPGDAGHIARDHTLVIVVPLEFEGRGGTTARAVPQPPSKPVVDERPDPFLRHGVSLLERPTVRGRVPRLHRQLF